MICLARKRLVEEVRANIRSIIPFAPEYVDDGFSGGGIDENLKFFQEESRLVEENDLWSHLNNYIRYLLVGDDFMEFLVE